MDDDGRRLELAIESPSSTPTVAITAAAEQLSQFGIETGWLSRTEQVFERGLDRGDVTMWPTDRGVGHALFAVGRLYLSLVSLKTRSKRSYGVFPPDAFEATTYDGEFLSPVAPENLGAFTLEAPPVGEPDGSLRTWHAPRLSWRCLHATSHEQYVETLERLAWLYNWHLPVLPIAHGHSQHFVDSIHWEWPFLDSPRSMGVGVSELQPEDLVALGRVSARTTERE